MKTYNGVYGHTYYYRDGILMGHPTNADGTCDMDELCETPVVDFVEPLTKTELREIIKNLVETKVELTKKEIQELVDEKIKLENWLEA